MSPLVRVGALVALLSLGCSSLIPGYGRELARTNIVSGQRVDLSVVGTGVPLDLWLKFDGIADGGDFDVFGDLDCGTSRSKRTSVPIRLKDTGVPRRGYQAGTLRAAKLDAVATGSTLRCRGTLQVEHFSKGTVELIVTE